MSTDSTSTWEDRFPFDEPYEPQQNGVGKILKNAKDGGFTTVEAACGSGKTLMAVMAGIELVRDPDTKYERVVALTSVKQQLRAFEDDIVSVNNNLPEGVSPIDALTIVGKADMCSYTATGHLSNDDIYSTCNSLRDTVRNQMSSAGDENEKVRVLESMVNAMEVDAVGAEDTLQTDDWKATIKDEHPEEKNSCAFYANYRLKQLKDESMIDLNGMMRPSDVVREASQNSVCPHAAMIDTLEDAEVVIGNYNHAFDPLTIEAMTGDIIDDETFLVCDEAHMIVPRVRDLLSDRVSYRNLKYAISQVEEDVVKQNDADVQEVMKKSLMESGVSPDDVAEFVDFLKALKSQFEEFALDALDETKRNWEETVLDMEDDIEYPLRPPDQSRKDKISNWMEFEGYESIADDAEHIGSAIADAIHEATEEVTTYNTQETYADSVGRVMTAWKRNGHSQYFRSLTLEKRDREFDSADLLWNRHFSPALEMKNCIPSDPIRERLEDFGGGLLMSATLAPLDVYREETGLDEMEDDTGRPVQELVYGLNFPQERRESMAVNATKFTGSNRGNPYGDNNETRETYKNTIEDVVSNTDGNVLVCMPSYLEAEWVEYELNPQYNQNVSKPIKADESSSNEETEDLKQWFFSGESKVLVTSLRGTLTEGVDYDGDKLDACVVCGVPIRGLGGPYPDAIRNAYESQFGNDGFDIAFNVPAVRKARQALGRVIRGMDDKGVRVLVDDRYAGRGWASVRDFLPKYERDEYQPTDAGDVEGIVSQFWRRMN